MFDFLKSLDKRAEKIAVNTVGSIAINWSTLEYFVDQALCEHLTTNDRTAPSIVTNEMNFRNQLAAIKHLSIHYDPAKQSKIIQKLCNLVDGKIRPERNWYIHGLFRYSEKTTIAHRKTQIKRPQAFKQTLYIGTETTGGLEYADLIIQSIRRSAFAFSCYAIHLGGEEKCPYEPFEWMAVIDEYTNHSANFIDRYKSLTKSEGDTLPSSSTDKTV